MTTPTTARELAKLLDKMGDLHAQMALINLADQVDTLTKERDALMAAGKLALDALEMANCYIGFESNATEQAQTYAAIVALEIAGVTA